jgi:hypothetical protein
MDKKTVFIKTAKGEREGADLPSDLKRIMSLIDNKSKADELAKRAPPSLREGWMDFLAELVEDGYIRDKNKPYAEPKITAPKSSLLKMFTPKTSDETPMEELDYNTSYVAPAPSAAELAAKRKADEAARVRDEMEAAVSAAKSRASAEAAAKAEAKAKQEAENAARAKALVAAEDARKAEYKAQKDAESAARAKAVAEAKAKDKAKQEAELRAQAEIKAKQVAAAKLQEQQEAARAKAALDAAARARAEIEAAARAQQVAEAKAKQEMAARVKAEQEAARVKAALEAAAKARIEEEARVRAEIEAAARAQQLAEEKARREAEAARLKAEQEARVKAELEAAKARAEAEAKALAEALARKAAEEKARLAAEAEAAALAEALARKVAEEKARLEAEEARLKAEQTAARIRAEQESAAKIRAETEIKAATEALVRHRHAEATKREAEEQALAPADNGFEINLDGFLDGADQVAKNAAPAGQYVRPASAEDDTKEKHGDGAATGTRSTKDIAAEMARLKSEAEAARRKLEEEARKQAEEKALSEEQSRAWEEAEQRATVQAVIEVEQAAQQAALQQAKSAHTPVPRKHRKPLPVGKIVFALCTLALVAAVVLPYIYPLDEYIAPLEQRLSARLKQPVHIGGMRAASLPPTLKLQNVVVGNQQEVKVGSIKLNFDVFSLFSENKVISNAEFEDASIQGNALEKQVASLKLMGGDAQYPVHHLTLQRLHIVTDEIALPVLSGIADLGAQGTFNRVSLHSANDKLDIDLQSNPGGRWQISLNLRESSLPILPDVVFDDLSAKGELSDGEVNFTEMDAHIFNGILLGKAKLDWNKGWQLHGSLEAKTFDLDKMFPKFHIEGEMYGEGKFSMSGNTLSKMGDDPRLDGSFSVKKGTINIDMVETARLLSRENLVGGRTHFDDMIGQVEVENGSVHFRQLKIVSAMLSSNGAFDVFANNRISGNFNAEIKMREGNNKLTLLGTLDEPKLRAGN